jgi:hypothetical protein
MADDDHLVKQQRTLEKIENNDPSIHSFSVGNNSSKCYYSKLGKAVATNPHITSLNVGYLRGDDALDITNKTFFDGIRHNSSIRSLLISISYQCISDKVIHEILKVYQEKRNISYLCIGQTNLSRNGADNIITTTLRLFSNIRHIRLNCCGITDELLLRIVEAVRGHSSLEELNIENNRIGNVGCQALATLIEDPNSNLQSLLLSRNSDNPIGNEGAMAIINSLSNNSKLKELQLYHHSLDPLHVPFRRLLGYAASINDIYSSNHVLEELGVSIMSLSLETLLKLNKGTNKKHVAIKKILQYHPNIDMESLYAWDSEGEWSLKALPYVIAWFERAEEADAAVDYQVEELKLAAIYQFARAMPLMFVTPPHIKADDKKRKKVAI